MGLNFWSSASIPLVLRSQTCAVRACPCADGGKPRASHMISSPTCWRWCRFLSRRESPMAIQRSQSWPAQPGPPPPLPPPLPKAQRPSSSSLSTLTYLIPFFKETKARFSKVLKVRVCIELSENFDIWYYKVPLSQTLSSFRVKARQNGENKIPKRRVLSYEVARWMGMSVLQSCLLLRGNVLLLGMVPEVLIKRGSGEGDASSRVTCWRLVLHK